MAFPLTRAAAVAWLLLVAAACPATGQVTAREYQVKAAFLQNFPQFVDWPALQPGGGAPLVIGIVGDDPFGPMLQTMLARTDLNGRPFVLAHLRWNERLSDCHILFISASELKHMPQILAAAPNALTVSDLDAFARRGGMIELRTINDRIRFEINIAAARRAGLRISSNLLRLALHVYDESVGGAP